MHHDAGETYLEYSIIIDPFDKYRIRNTFNTFIVYIAR